jgi:hypothetical protein
MKQNPSKLHIISSNVNKLNNVFIFRQEFHWKMFPHPGFINEGAFTGQGALVRASSRAFSGIMMLLLLLFLNSIASETEQKYPKDIVPNGRPPTQSSRFRYISRDGWIATGLSAVMLLILMMVMVVMVVMPSWHF